MFSGVCKLCGASTIVQRCSCVCVSEQTKCGASCSGQRHACDKEDITGTHFILQTTKQRKTSYQKVTGSGHDTSPARQFSSCCQPYQINDVSSWEPSLSPAGGLECAPELVEEAMKMSYKKRSAAREVNRPRREKEPPGTPCKWTSSGFRSKRLAHLRHQGNNKPTNLQAAIDNTTLKL